jgi:protein-disulfide isomerase
MAVVGLLVAGVIVMAAATGGGGSGGKLADAIDKSAASLPQQKGFSIGRADAPLVLQVYEDFQCPYCVKFTANVEPTLMDEYVATGKLRMEFQNFPILGNESASAAAAAVCAAEQNRAWNYILALYSLQARENQAETERLNVGRFDAEGLLERAGAVPLDRQAFQACVASGSAVETVVQQHAAGVAAGITGTPGFVLNGELVTNVPGDVESWRAFLDGELAAAQ